MRTPEWEHDAFESLVDAAQESTDPTDGMSEEEYRAFWELPAAQQNHREKTVSEGEFPW